MKFKHLLVAAALLVGSASMVRAEFREDIPIGPEGALTTADYGGVFVATFSPTRGDTRIYIPGPATVYDATFSSASDSSENKFITFWPIQPSTMTTLYTSTSGTTAEAWRWYVDDSTANANGYRGTYRAHTWPKFWEYGWIVTSSASPINSIGIGYHRKRIIKSQ